jgi:glycosyltransferase involved in cell wall biosynthesis
VVFSGPVDNPFPLLAGARALCVTSDAEADPMAVLEAAALGVPVIAREAALDWRALAERGISCTRVSDDPAQLATAIVASVRAAPRSAGHRSAAGYDAARMADEHLRALESVGVRSPRSR